MQGKLNKMDWLQNKCALVCVCVLLVIMITTINCACWQQLLLLNFSPALSQYCIAESVVKRDNSVVFELLEKKKDTIKNKAAF